MGRGTLQVLMVLPSFVGGGVESVALALVRGLGGRHVITVAGFGEGPMEASFRAAGAEVRVLAAPDLAELVREIGPDLLHCHDRVALSSGLAVKKIFTCDPGKTTVPISRPSATSPGSRA